MAKWHRSIASGEPFENEARHRSAEGEYRFFLVRAVPLRDERGKVVRWYGTLTDIEDRKRAEQERARLRQLESDLAYMGRILTMGELAASLAHEIKQPITAAVMNAEACRHWLRHDASDVVQAADAASSMLANAMRAADIIDKVRSLYLKGRSSREPFDLHEVVREITILLSDTAKRDSVSIRTELDVGLPKATGDRVQLQQVLMNLMLNGVEAMKDAGGELTVSGKPTEDGQLLISVSDTGMGLPSDDPGRLSRRSSPRKPQGTGLGSLHQPGGSSSAHGERLWASANSGRGATFNFTLPAEAAPNASCWAAAQFGGLGLFRRGAAGLIPSSLPSPPGRAASSSPWHRVLTLMPGKQIGISPVVSLRGGSAQLHAARCASSRSATKVFIGIASRDVAVGVIGRRRAASRGRRCV